MSIDFENLTLFDFLLHDKFNIEFVHHIFGSNLDWDWINNIKIDFDAQNHWIWGPRTLKASIESTVYDYLVIGDPNPWPGWHHIWKLCVLPRIKIFTWKMAHGKLPTGCQPY